MRTGTRHGERGAMDLGAIISLVLLLAAVSALWNAGPIYFQYFQFIDEVEQAARAYPRTQDGNDACHARVWKKAVELGIDEYMSERDIEVSLAGTDRKVYFYYEVEGKVIPGWRRTFKFEKEISQPLL